MIEANFIKQLKISKLTINTFRKLFCYFIKQILFWSNMYVMSKLSFSQFEQF